MKLVLLDHISDGATYSCIDTIPFEFSSKDDFVLEILERVEKAKKNKEHYIKLSDMERMISIEDAESIEGNVFTLEEWFEKYKVENFLV